MQREDLGILLLGAELIVHQRGGSGKLKIAKGFRATAFIRLRGESQSTQPADGLNLHS
jgi:hypothetical protein